MPFKKGLSRVQISLFCIRDEQFGRRRGQNPTICTREDQWEERCGQKPAICTRAISFSGSQQTQTRCNLTCFHDVYWAVITMMGKPDSGMARGELRSTLSRAGSCRCSAYTIILKFALYTSRKQGKLQSACACDEPEIYGGKSSLFVHVV